MKSLEFNAWVDKMIEWHRGSLRILERLPRDQVIACVVCDGKSPEPNQCGCGGTCTVADAIEHHAHDEPRVVGLVAVARSLAEGEGEHQSSSVPGHQTCPFASQHFASGGMPAQTNGLTLSEPHLGQCSLTG